MNRLIRNLYPILILAIIILNISPTNTQAQCNCSGGVAPTQLVYQATDTLFTGGDSVKFNISQFDPALGTLTCVDVQGTITGVVTMKLENNNIFATRYRIRYDRYDDISGAGLSPSLNTAISKNYGPYNLAAADGNSQSGPDYVVIGPDSILNKKVMSTTINSGVAAFMGAGTVTYAYTSFAMLSVNGSSQYDFNIQSLDVIEFQLTYNYCPNSFLALNSFDFNLGKKDISQVQLNWVSNKEQDVVAYTIEVAINNNNFQPVSSVKSKDITNGSLAVYDYVYNSTGVNGLYYFRIKQVKKNGEYQYSAVRSSEFQKKTLQLLQVFPNPVTDHFSITLPGGTPADYRVELVNSVGQTVFKKEFPSYKTNKLAVTLSAKIAPGVYHLRVANTIGSPAQSSTVFIK